MIRHGLQQGGIGILLAMLLAIEAIPLGVLVTAALDRDLRHRSSFGLRFAGIVSVTLLPVLAAMVVPMGEDALGILIWGALGWGMLLLIPARFVLFHGRGPNPGRTDDEQGSGPEDPGPEDPGPAPRPPIGGLPLPDAEPASTRLRDHRPPRRILRPRRPVREHDRPPVRVWPFWLRPVH